MAEIVAEHRLIQGFGSGEFFFEDSENPDEDDLIIAAIEEAHERGSSVGCVDGHGVVMAPFSHGRAMVTVQAWDGEPLRQLDADADDLVDLDWDADGDLVLTEPTSSDTRVAVPPGRYRLRIGGFGLSAAQRVESLHVASMWTPATWVLRLWPREADNEVEYHRVWASAPNG